MAIKCTLVNVFGIDAFEVLYLTLVISSVANLVSAQAFDTVFLINEIKFVQQIIV